MLLGIITFVIIAGVSIIRKLQSPDDRRVIVDTLPSGLKPIEIEKTAIVIDEDTPPPARFTPPEPIVPDPQEIPPAQDVLIESNPQTTELIEDANRDIASGKIVAARDKLNQLLIAPAKISPTDLVAVKKLLAELSKKWLFSRDKFPGDALTSLYKVQPGDRLADIGKKYKVPYEILMKINDIKRPELLRAGRTIKVIQGPFHVKIYRSTYTLDLYLGNKTYVKSFRVGLGELGKDTPSGGWRVRTNGKLVSPPWPSPEGRMIYPEDSDYPLGSRWIGMEGIDGEAKGRTGFGIHGTKDSRTIGTRSSMGCIRLYNGNVIELYDMLTPGISEIRIVD